MRDILIVKPSSLGDIVHALAAAQSIRDQLPDARISWVVRDRFAAVVEGCPTVNGEVFRYARDRGLRGLFDICAQLRRQRFDCVIDWQGLARTAAMTIAARAPLRIGRSDAREGAVFAYSKRSPLPADGRESHAIAVLLEALPLLELEARLGAPIELAGTDPATLSPALAEAAPVVLVPNSRGAHKEWPGFLGLAEALLAGPGDFPVVLDSHVPWETPTTLQDPRFINLTGQTDLAAMIGLVRSARLVVVNDAGPLHIAAAMGTPVLGLFGLTSATRFGPFPPGRPGNVVLQAPGGDLAKLDVAEVAQAALAMLKQPTVGAT